MLTSIIVIVVLTGKTTTIGHNIGALSQSPSKGVPVSYSGTCCPAATTTRLVPVTSLITIKSCSSQLGTCTSLTTSSSLRGIPSSSGSSQISCSTSTSPPMTLPAGNINKKELCLPASVLSNSSLAQITTTVGSCPAQTPSPNPALFNYSLSYKSTEEKASFLLPSKHAHNKIQTPFTSTPTTCTTFTTSTGGTVQQRIIINTSTPLAAGTQILLNGTRFIVPPQGLGPGSHVLIISSPTPQVPTASSTSTGLSVPPKEAIHASLSPQTAGLRQPEVRLPGVQVVNSFTACTPATGPSLPTSTHYVTPFRLTGTPLQSSTLLPSKTNVSASLRLPPAHPGNFSSPVVGTSSLVSSTLSLGSVPALVSPVITSAGTLGSVKVTANTPGPAMQAECSSIKSSAVVPPLPGSMSSFPLSPSLSVGTPCGPIIPAPTPLSSAAASVTIGHQQVIAVATLGPGLQPQQTTVRPAAPSAGHPQQLVDTRQKNASIRKHVSLMPPVVVGTQTPVMPTVAVPPIVSAVSRMQTLPVATVPPIGSTVSTFETVAVAGPPSSSTTVIITPAQPITSLKTKNPDHPPVIRTNQAHGKPSVQTSASGKHASVTSKLLISPDGAVLSTIRCQVNPAEVTACPKPLDALVICSNSSTGALQTHDSTLQPPQADTK